MPIMNTFNIPWFNSTITILNRLQATDNNGIDGWKKTVLRDCFWKTQSERTIQRERSVQGKTISNGNTVVCRIPKNENYKPYNIWKNDTNGFTFSAGDFLILGEIEEIDIVADNIIKIVNRYKPDAFSIKNFQDNTGKINALEHYLIEGV